MTATPRLAHVLLKTSQLERMAQWYCTVLRGHVVYQGHGLAFITFDAEHHRIALMSVPESPIRAAAPAGSGLHHTAFTFDGLDDLLERYSELAEQDIEPVAPVQHGVTTSLYYEDPDGNRVEMQIDNFGTPDEATAYMRGPEYDNDPIGPPFDVARMVKARRDGVPTNELITRAWALSASPGPEWNRGCAGG